MEDLDKLKLDVEDKLIIEEVRNLSKVNTNQVNDFFKALLLLCLLNFSEDETLKIPYLGELKIDYKGDKNTKEGRVADLETQFIPSESLVRNVGQLVDVKDPSNDTKITDIDCIKDIMNDISKKLNDIMKKEE